MLKHKADVRTLVFMGLTMTLLGAQWTQLTFSWSLFLLSCLMGVTVAVMAHNHNHVPIWRSRTINRLQDYWITCFYGYPTFGWIATHNQNHHVLNNRPGDDSITWRLTEANTWWSLLTYPAVSGRVQQAVNRRFLRAMWHKNRALAWYYISQIAVLVVFTGFWLILDWKKALLYVVIPQQCGLNAVLVFNYVQHVHADERHEWNHSRNFVSPIVNFVLFNNGYHTVHHMNPTRHWSENARAHAEVEDQIDPSLNEKSFVWFMLRVYVLGVLVRRGRTTSLRLQRMARTGERRHVPPTKSTNSSAA